MRNLFLLVSAFLTLGVTNLASAAGGDFENYIADQVLPLARRQLVAYQFGKPLRLPDSKGTTYTATRFQRLPLPYAQLQEGVAPQGESLTLTQVSATVQQWGDLVRVTDVANLTPKHPLFKQAIRLVGLQQPETIERNTFTTLLAANQVNYANGRASRAAIVATDVLTPHEANKITGSLETYGAPQYMGDEREDMKIDAGAYRNASKSPASMPHYVALIHPLVSQDMRENSQINTAWSFSDINRLYNNELGEYGGVRYCKTNMIPYWVGVADPASNTAGVAGSLAGAPTNYYIQITGSPFQTSVEQQIYQVSGAVSVTGPNGSISVVLPVLAGYVFNVYIGTTTSPVNLGLTTSGPQTGPLAGQATQLASGATVVITGVGAAQTPPAAPATGVTVFPTIFLGESSYGQVVLENPEYHYLKEADKSDPNNQTRVVSWKMFYGSILLNQAFLARCESSSAFSTGYTAGTAAVNS